MLCIILLSIIILALGASFLSTIYFTLPKFFSLTITIITTKEGLTCILLSLISFLLYNKDKVVHDFYFILYDCMGYDPYYSLYENCDYWYHDYCPRGFRYIFGHLRCWEITDSNFCVFSSAWKVSYEKFKWLFCKLFRIGRRGKKKKKSPCFQSQHFFHPKKKTEAETLFYAPSNFFDCSFPSINT